MKLDKMQLARLIAWLAPKMKFAVTEDNIRDLDDLINVDMPQPDMAYPSVSDINNLMALMAAGTQKIEAIKVHRKLTGWGLKESKDQVEKYWKPAPVANDTYGPGAFGFRGSVGN